ncbi:FAD dependent oxidoreductase superfamily [Grosmannia clavigera kw1407]|uniref:FAD dependent oxidoreductase superfamily n=1 Tax=Grosmannia clavigera (strain kw1407 / UAMH 11150) TaxID=655863 RepID=F0XKM1_GROCL|nr:FAD dependent oxidoreductase superfamily [Grosmannia clavigera kw1407]EFX01761.1 FAD dependent oxidoreductase superfamily [Grosmannia clavigera kw1407]
MGGGSGASKPRFGFPKATGSSMSYWLLSAQGDQLLDYRTTDTLPETADIVIIGSGMTGTLTAKHCLDTWPNKKIVVLEARKFCSGATGRNAGHCKPDRWRGFRDYEERFGKDEALKILDNEHRTWSALVDYARTNQVDCDLWVGDTLDVPTTAEDARQAKQCFDVYRAAGGSADLVKVIDDPQEAVSVTRIASALACYAYPVSTLNPWKLTAHVMRANLERGVHLQTHTPVVCVRAAHGSSASEARWIVDTPRGSIACPTVVHATNGYSSALEPSLRGLITPQPHMCDKVVAPAPTFQGSHRLDHSYSVLVGGDGGFFSINPRRSIPDGGPEETVVLFGGDNPGQAALQAWLDANPEHCVDDSLLGFPAVSAAVRAFAESQFQGWTDGARPAKYDRSWSGIMGVTADGMPFVGELPGLPGQWICAGHNGHGMACIFTAAPGLVELMAGRSWAETQLPAPFQITTARLSHLAQDLGEQALFTSPFEIESIRKSVIPRTGIADEQGLRPFIHTAIEAPATAILKAHFKILQPDKDLMIEFMSSAYGRLPQSEPPSKKASPVKDVMPNRWAFLVDADPSNDLTTAILVGEYKAPHKLKAATLHNVMSRRPGDTFFPQAIRTKLPEEQLAPAEQPTRTGSNASSYRVPGHVLVAQVLCQAYHYIIGSGCEYGYVSSGDSLVFLRVLADAPETLYYHSVRFSVPPILKPDERRRQNAGLRSGSETAVAHIVSLCLWAAETTPRPLGWIDTVRKNAPRWPASKVKTDSSQPRPFGSPDDKGSGGGGGGGDTDEAGPRDPPRLPLPSGPLKRGRSPTRREPPSGGGMTALAAAPSKPYGSFVEEPPRLPYCTQACLRGLTHGLPLDSSCPNVALHRKAHRHGSKAMRRRSLSMDGHPLTAASLASLVVAQIAANVDKDCECLDKRGMYGRFGVLFKIAATGYGYTFVGKSVEAADYEVLEREAHVYNAVPDLQGRLIPVFLGVVELARPIPLRTFIDVSHMLLMSYAGPSLYARHLLPRNVDMDAEADRSMRELEIAGVYNDDRRDCNLAWNEEVRRVMHLDFDRAWLHSPPKPTPPSPLLVKTEWTAEFGDDDSDSRAMKRTRTTDADT